MIKILSYFKYSTALFSVLIGVQFPSFIDQYGKNLNSRLSESNNSIVEFQNDADEFFKGNLTKLIEHYENDEDPVIISGGDTIRVITLRNKQLLEAQTKFQKSYLYACVHVLIYPIKEIRTDVWENYTYSITLNKTAILSAIIFLISALAIFDFVIFLISRIL